MVIIIQFEENLAGRLNELTAEALLGLIVIVIFDLLGGIYQKVLKRQYVDLTVLFALQDQPRFFNVFFIDELA